MPLALPTLPAAAVLCMVGEVPPCDVVMLVCWPNALLRRAKAQVPFRADVMWRTSLSKVFRAARCYGHAAGSTACPRSRNLHHAVSAQHIPHRAAHETVSLSNEILMSSLESSRLSVASRLQLDRLTRTVRS